MGYWKYSGSVIMDQADAGLIPGGYTASFQAFALLVGGLLLACSLALLLIRIVRN